VLHRQKIDDVVDVISVDSFEVLRRISHRNDVGANVWKEAEGKTNENVRNDSIEGEVELESAFPLHVVSYANLKDARGFVDWHWEVGGDFCQESERNLWGNLWKIEGKKLNIGENMLKIDGA
jgi:hypothetical protein